ncbi:MAG: hypothetical protein ACHQ0J_05545 [Candidatus Dormibacterales bacterium]
MRRLIGILLLAAFVGACGSAALVPAVTASRLPLTEAVKLMDSADAARSEALATSSSQGLAQVFRNPALKALTDRVDAMALRGLRLEETSAVRSLAAFDPGRLDGVLQVVAADRLITPDQSDPTWSATERQVWSRFTYSSGRWWVADAKDLSPDRWVPAPV